jgi:GNAT superfamily N-acetyltransferase
MPPTHEIVAVTDDLTAHGTWLARAEGLYRAFRVKIPTDYDGYLRGMFVEGAEMAILHVGGGVKSLVMYRCHHTTFHGFRFYVDDLVTDEAERAQGFGGALLRWCEQRARARGCDSFDLESGVQRPRTHKFYFREGLSIFAFGFTKPLQSSPWELVPDAKSAKNIG